MRTFKKIKIINALREGKATKEDIAQEIKMRKADPGYISARFFFYYTDELESALSYWDKV